MLNTWAEQRSVRLPDDHLRQAHVGKLHFAMLIPQQVRLEENWQNTCGTIAYDVLVRNAIALGFAMLRFVPACSLHDRFLSTCRSFINQYHPVPKLTMIARIFATCTRCTGK